MVLVWIVSESERCLLVFVRDGFCLALVNATNGVCLRMCGKNATPAWFKSCFEGLG
ncbi:hypothetical protein RE6C_03542 [Rhodopirellula europaea 6C]|uniref:Uncharacterized protein n=1 Tax=Rhodopirellula europaea 6C TaxID=1263867 RepID=M2B1R6_9BACT|nr:hypothetical protein RE6C_03542 [Rhodopirellula europaea 6C]